VADPLDVLRTPDAPAAPDPDFAARLRARIERALTLPKGVAVTMTTVEQPTDRAVGGSGALTPYLAVADARAAIEWYVANLGARRIGEPIVMPDGRIGHAELELAGARMFVSDEHPEVGVAAPGAGTGTAVSLHLNLPDVDAVIAKAAGSNAVVEREPSNNPYGRIGVIRDPFGHRWMLNSPPAAPSEPARDGDVGFFSLCVDDVDKAAAFYAAVLGWTYIEDSGPRRTLAGMPFPYRITGLAFLRALADRREYFWPGQQHPVMFCSRGVADVDAAVERVRAAGGRSTDPQETPHGRSADCIDDQGAPFSLHENKPETQRPAMNGSQQGDVAYLTMQVIDSTRACNFYGAVFGWTFTAGHVEDGWEPHDPAPMTGVHGGHERATQVPMFRVEDIAAAVERVRAAGGTATGPERQPYGMTAQCIDDQGMPFYLGQL
jgi:predicted enzyme related to lactoylglutathione lyase